MRLKSRGTEFIDVNKTKNEFIVQNQFGYIVLKRKISDERGARAIANLINNLQNNYDWKEIKLV